MITWEELMQHLQVGGVVGIVTLVSLFIGSILSIAVIIERLWTIRGFLRGLRTLSDSISASLAGGSLTAAKKTASKGKPSSVSRIFLAGINAAIRGARMERIEAIVDRERQKAGLALRRWLWILGTIGATAPFIGLFGTVVGILRAMGKIQETGDTGFDVVAGEIGEALIATAVGIAVAIEAVILFNAIQSRLQAVALELRLTLEEFVEEIYEVTQPHSKTAVIVKGKTTSPKEKPVKEIDDEEA